MTLRRRTTSPDPSVDAVEAQLKREDTAGVRPVSFFRVSVVNLHTRAVSYTVIPFNETKTIENIIDTITNKNPVEDRGAYGLWVEHPACPAGEFLLEERTAVSYNLQGEVTAAFKMKPWKVSIFLPNLPLSQSSGTSPGTPTSTPTSSNIDHSEQTIQKEFLPGSNCGQLISQVTKQFQEENKIEPSIEFGIFLTDDETGECEWLEDNKWLVTYRINKRKAKLILAPIPKTLSVFLRDGSSETINIKLQWTINALMEEILSLKKIPKDHVNDYGVRILQSLADLSSVNVVTDWLQSTRTLASYGVTSSTILQLGGRDRPITIITPSGERKDIEIPFTLPVSEIEQLLCEKLSTPQNEYALRLFISEDESQRLIPWNSLRDQNVKDNARLSMVKKTLEDSSPTDSDVNIWEEPEEGTITYNDEHILVCASLNKLVENLTSEKNHDPGFMRTVLLTYRSFTTPEMLFKKLVERFHVPSTCDDSKRDLIRMRVYTVIKHWLEQQGEDLGSVFDRIAGFIEDANLHNDSPNLASLVSRLKVEIAARSAKKEITRYKFANPPPPAKVPKNMNNTILVMDLDELEIARQMTLPLFDILNAIRPEELFNNAWSKANKEKRAPNILKFIDQFNFYAGWVSSLIVQEVKLSNRAKVYNKLVMIAQKLRELNNFHLLTAFISGFNNSSINRLKWSRGKLPKRSQQILRELEILTNMEGSFKNYRIALKSTAPPCIPYIGVQLMDLTFIEDGNPDQLNGLINWQKRVLVYEIFQSIQKYQTTGYNLAVVKEFQDWLKAQTILDEKELYSQSLLREPRGCDKADLQ